METLYLQAHTYRHIKVTIIGIIVLKVILKGTEKLCLQVPKSYLYRYNKVTSIGTEKLYLKVQKSYVYRYRKVIIIGTEKLYLLWVQKT